MKDPWVERGFGHSAKHACWVERELIHSASILGEFRLSSAFGSSVTTLRCRNSAFDPSSYCESLHAALHNGLRSDRRLDCDSLSYCETIRVNWKNCPLRHRAAKSWLNGHCCTPIFRRPWLLCTHCCHWLIKAVNIFDPPALQRHHSQTVRSRSSSYKVYYVAQT